MTEKTFLGWENGLSGYPKTNTIEAPKDPTRNKPKGVLKLKNESVPIVRIENILAVRALLKFSFIVLIMFPILLSLTLNIFSYFNYTCKLNKKCPQSLYNN